MPIATPVTDVAPLLDRYSKIGDDELEAIVAALKAGTTLEFENDMQAEIVRTHCISRLGMEIRAMGFGSIYLLAEAA